MKLVPQYATQSPDDATSLVIGEIKSECKVNNFSRKNSWIFINFAKN